MVEAVEFLQDGSFTVRRVDAAAAGQLDFSDSEHVFGPLVEEADNFRVDGINGLAVFLQIGFVGWLVDFPGHCGMNLLAKRRMRRRPVLSLVACWRRWRRALLLRPASFPNRRAQ